MLTIFKHACMPQKDNHASSSLCELGYIESVPIIAAVFLALCCVFAPAYRNLRPRWTKPFVPEYPSEDSHELNGNGKAKASTSYQAVLLILTAGACILARVIVLVTEARYLDANHLVGIVPWALIIGLVAHMRPRTFSLLLTLFYVSVVVVELLSMGTEHSLASEFKFRRAANQICALLSLCIISTLPFRGTSTASNVGITPSELQPSPEDNLNLWQFLTVSWMWPLISIGKQRTLNENDVWQLSYQFQHHRLHDEFQKLSGSVLRRLCFANALDFVIIPTIAIVSLVAEYSLPLLLQRLLQAMSQPGSHQRRVVIFALLSLLARATMAQLAVLNIWFGRRCYERSRGELIMAVYAKALARKNVVGSSVVNSETDEAASQPAMQSLQRNWLSRMSAKFNPFSSAKTVSPTAQYASVGKILNVVRGDIYEVAQRFWEIDRLLTVPLGVVFSSALIWNLLGPSCFLGIITLVVSQLLNYQLIRLSIALGKVRKAASDTRIQATSQYIEVIRHLRWYGWQSHWLSQVQEARSQEMAIRIKTMLLNAIIAFINAVSRALFPVAALFSYTYLAGNTLSIDLIFPALSLFSSLDARLMDLPDLITTLINAHISMQRINGLMAEPEISETDDNVIPVEPIIVLEDVDFAWPEQDTPVLTRINLRISSGLTLVIGKVGSGKTALLQGLLGELDQMRGTCHLANEPVAYCSQTPWLQSMSIRDNILFFSPFDQERYNKVVNACELRTDLLNFKHGDMSNIGENGIGLSGGQRARIALARAVYNRSRILLLDDPLSALDHQTAESIVKSLFSGSLVTGRIVVLVTHRLELVQDIADLIINVGDGTAKRQLMTRSTQSTQADHSSANSTTESESHEAADANGLTTTPDKFIEDERRAEWGVQARVYWTYVKAGGLQYWAIDVLVLTMSRLISFVYTWFIKAWGEAYGTSSLLALAASSSYTDQIYPLSLNMSIPNLKDLPHPEEDVRPWLWMFLFISLLGAAITFLSWMVDIVIMYTAAKHLFSQVMIKVSHATFRFYDVTPIGRLMNRMTSDISTVDGTISQHFGRIALQAVTWISSVIIIASITPAFLLFSATLMLLFVFIFSQFLPTSQSLRRLETVSLSPLFANFGELLQGLTTVRAFHAGTQFQDRIIAVVDRFQGMDHFFWSLQSWVSYRFQLLAAVSTFTITILALYLRLSPGLTAFALSIANMFVNSTNFLCRRYGELQMEFVSVERIEELLHLDQEPTGTIEPPAIWPRTGADIVFQNVSVRYAPHLDLALNDIDLVIPGGATVALVGRTGSGKSTLAQALLGVVRPESGSVLIDNLSVDEVMIDALRQRVTFVAQDPILFTGTIRHNLDPLEQFTDEECAAVLERICHRQGWSLATTIEPGGRNISQGQRQLIGITRAVLRRSSVVILDEATASIDYETSMEIQSVLRDELRHSTVVIIAHRVEAVRGADYAIILDHGRVLRQGPAKDLLAQ